MKTNKSDAIQFLTSAVNKISDLYPVAETGTENYLADLLRDAVDHIPADKTWADRGRMERELTNIALRIRDDITGRSKLWNAIGNLWDAEFLKPVTSIICERFDSRRIEDLCYGKKTADDIQLALRTVDDVKSKTIFTLAPIEDALKEMARIESAYSAAKN